MARSRWFPSSLNSRNIVCFFNLSFYLIQRPFTFWIQQILGRWHFTWDTIHSILWFDTFFSIYINQWQQRSVFSTASSFACICAFLNPSSPLLCWSSSMRANSQVEFGVAHPKKFAQLNGPCFLQRLSLSSPPFWISFLLFSWGYTELLTLTDYLTLKAGCSFLSLVSRISRVSSCDIGVKMKCTSFIPNPEISSSPNTPFSHEQNPE